MLNPYSENGSKPLHRNFKIVPALPEHMERIKEIAAQDHPLHKKPLNEKGVVLFSIIDENGEVIGSTEFVPCLMIRSLNLDQNIERRERVFLFKSMVLSTFEMLKNKGARFFYTWKCYGHNRVSPKIFRTISLKLSHKKHRMFLNVGE